MNQKMVTMLGIGVVVVSAFIIRTYQLYDNFFFGFEQGRDMLALVQIASGDISLIGPWTSIPGFFHGVLSYWTLIPSFLLFRGDPYLIAVSLIAVNVISLVFLYDGLRILFDKRVAILSIILIALSYTSILYARWLSNPNLVPVLVNLLVFSLARSTKDNRFLVILAAVWAVMFHLQSIVAGLLFVPTLISIFLLKIKITKKILLASVTTILLLFSSYFIFELRNEFIMSRSVHAYITDSGLNTKNTTNEIFSAFSDEITRSLYPEDMKVSMILFAVLVVGYIGVFRKNSNYKMLGAFLFFVPLVYFASRTRPLTHYLMHNHIFLSVLVAALLVEMKGAVRVIFVAIFVIVVFGNLSTYVSRVPISRANFIHHAQRTYLADEIDMIDEIYSQAEGNSFTYDYYTVPYWQPEAWRYLFLWYAGNKYGYEPSYEQNERSDPFYVIIEPDESNPIYQDNWYGELMSESDLIEKYEFGKLKLEKRTPKHSNDEDK